MSKNDQQQNDEAGEGEETQAEPQESLAQFKRRLALGQAKLNRERDFVRRIFVSKKHYPTGRKLM